VSDDIALVASIATSSVLFVVALYGSIALVRRGRLSRRMAAVALAFAGAALPWIVMAFGLRWDLPFAVSWSAIVFVIVALGAVRAFERIPPKE
jgi:hypothetical protein